MSDIALKPGYAAAPIPVREVLPWFIFSILLLMAIYFVGAEEGAASPIPGMYVNDGRHLPEFPCH